MNEVEDSFRADVSRNARSVQINLSYQSVAAYVSTQLRTLEPSSHVAIKAGHKRKQHPNNNSYPNARL